MTLCQSVTRALVVRCRGRSAPQQRVADCARGACAEARSSDDATSGQGDTRETQTRRSEASCCLARLASPLLSRSPAAPDAPEEERRETQS